MTSVLAPYCQMVPMAADSDSNRSRHLLVSNILLIDVDLLTWIAGNCTYHHQNHKELAGTVGLLQLVRHGLLHKVIVDVQSSVAVAAAA